MKKFYKLIKIKHYILPIFENSFNSNFPLDIYDYLIDLSFETGTDYNSLQPISLLFSREKL
jgi:hypothetical protein